MYIVCSNVKQDLSKHLYDDIIFRIGILNCKVKGWRHCKNDQAENRKMYPCNVISRHKSYFTFKFNNNTFRKCCKNHNELNIDYKNDRPIRNNNMNTADITFIIITQDGIE